MASLDPQPTDVIGVMRSHLEEIQTALDWARGYFMSLDMADAYRQGKPQIRPSRSAAAMERALNHTEGYLSVGEPDGS